MKKIFLLLILVCVCTFGVNAQGLDMQATIPVDPAVRIGKLDNGLTYYIRHNAKPEKQGEFYILHNVGAIQEEDSQVGLAHFLEHMAFNGTKNFPDKGIINYLETIGVKFGQNLNAGTGQDLTIYNISSVPLTREGIIDTALTILHDWSYFITLDPKEIDKERGVITEELRTGNTAAFRLREKTSPVLYNGAKYAQRNIIGNAEALKSFSHKELVDFYHKWYRTDLQTIVLVGDFDVDQMEAKVKKIMADIPASENPAPKVPVVIPDNVEPLISVATDPEHTMTDVTIYVKRQPLPTVMNDKVVGAKINTVIDFIGQMANYRLTEITQKADAPFVQAGVGQGALTATVDVLMARAYAREGEADKAFKALYTETEKIRRFGFTEGELERAKSDMLRSAEQTYDNRNDRRSGDLVYGYIDHFRDNAAIPSAEVEWQLDSSLITTTTLVEVNAIAQQLITNENQVVIITAPEKENVAKTNEAEIKAIIAEVRGSELEAYADNTVKEPLISTELKSGKVTSTAAGKFGATEWILSNGLKVVVKPTDFKADEILFSAATKGGLSIFSDQEFPSAEMLATLVEMSGLSKFSALDLSKQLAGKSISAQAVVSNYEHGINGSASPKDIETMLQLVYLYYTAPRFDRNDFDVMLGQYKAVFANAASNPNYIMQDSITNTLYGHNLRRQVLSPKRLESVNFEAMPALYKKLYGNPADFVYTIVGNVNLETLKPLVEKYLGSLSVTKPSMNFRDDNVSTVKGDVKNRFEVPMQAPKTTVYYNINGEIPFNLENYMTLDALRQILSIRYTESVREEKGGTYGVGVGATLSKLPKNKYTLQIKFDTDPAMADELMEIISEELNKMAAEGPKAEDLSKVKEFMIKQRPDDLKLNTTWVNYIEKFYTRGDDLNTDYDKLLSELSVEKIKTLAAKIVKESNVTNVIMDPKK